METKKTPEADLENKRILFFLMGFAVVLSAFYVLMEWESAPSDDGYYPELPIPAFIENEFDANIQTGIEDIQPIEQYIVIPENEEKTIYEGYEVVDKVSPEEDAMQDSIQNVQIQSLEPEDIMHEETVQQSNAKLTETETNDEDAEAEAMPQFPGGNIALIRYIYSQIQYPSAALKQRIEGRVWCSFFVNRDGTVSDVVLEQGIYIFLDEEAVRVLKTMPPWIPGKNQGKNIKVKVYLPIVFKI